MDEERDPVAVLGGTALRVYMYLLSRDDFVGVRDLQRALGFKSPSTARHHLERLAELGLLKKSSTGYKALPPKGILREIIVIKGRLLPRSIFVTGFLIAATIAYVLLPGRDPAASILLAVASILQSTNTYRLYKSIKNIIKKD
ncbi:MAG: LexA family transcriptional regulator [Desulfurococcales archaeon]|nr:LexA family transcriptional regulator [Desulfurococcales archaeon]